MPTLTLKTTLGKFLVCVLFAMLFGSSVGFFVGHRVAEIEGDNVADVLLDNLLACQNGTP